jgi:hypothetical protein
MVHAAAARFIYPCGSGPLGGALEATLSTEPGRASRRPGAEHHPFAGPATWKGTGPWARELTAAAVVFPGTRLRLVYAIADQGPKRTV